MNEHTTDHVKNLKFRLTKNIKKNEKNIQSVLPEQSLFGIYLIDAADNISCWSVNCHIGARYESIPSQLVPVEEYLNMMNSGNNTITKERHSYLYYNHIGYLVHVVNWK